MEGYTAKMSYMKELSEIGGKNKMIVRDVLDSFICKTLIDLHLLNLPKEVVECQSSQLKLLI